MADKDQDAMLREMARHRGFRLVKSRRRKQGGDRGKFGLTDAGTGKKCFGFGEKGLTAAAGEIESYLRNAELSTWKESVGSAKRRAPKAAQSPVEAEAPARRKRKASKEKPAPPPAAKPKPKPEPEPELRIRTVRKSDAEALAGLLAELGDRPDAKAVAARLAALARTGPPVLVAERGGLVGCAAWHVVTALHRPPLGRLTMVAVARDARRQGIGRALVEAAEAGMRDRGCGLFEAVSDIDFSGAQGFFRKLGYQKTGYRFAKPTAL